MSTIMPLIKAHFPYIVSRALSLEEIFMARLWSLIEGIL